MKQLCLVLLYKYYCHHDNCTLQVYHSNLHINNLVQFQILNSHTIICAQILLEHSVNIHNVHTIFIAQCYVQPCIHHDPCISFYVITFPPFILIITACITFIPLYFGSTNIFNHSGDPSSKHLTSHYPSTFVVDSQHLPTEK